MPQAKPSKPSAKHKILFVDDAISVLKVFKQTMGKRYQVDIAESGEKGLDLVRQQGPYTIIISDLRMPGMDGIQFITEAKKVDSDSDFMILTEYAEPDMIIKAIEEREVSKIIFKPFGAQEIVNEVREAIKRYEKKKLTGNAKPFAQSEEPTWKLVKAIVNGLKEGQLKMPVIPQIVQELQKVIKDPNSTNDNLARVIEKDAVISLKLISVAGSYIYRGRKKDPDRSGGHPTPGQQGNPQYRHHPYKQATLRD